MKLTTLTTATLTLCSSLFAINPADSLPEYDLVKKDFINGEINNERVNQIILKDPRLVPKSRGGIKDDIDADKDGLGIIVLGKLENGRVGGLVLSNDNDSVKENLGYLISKYGNKAKESGLSVLEYVKEGVNNGVLSGVEAETIKNKLSRNDIVSVTLSLSNESPSLSDLVTITVNDIVGNENSDSLNYQWSVGNSVQIETNNENSIIVSFLEPGPFNVKLTVVDPDGNGEATISSTVGVNSIASIEDAYNSNSAKIDGIIKIDNSGEILKWDGTYWRTIGSNEIKRYPVTELVKEIIDFSVILYQQDSYAGRFESHGGVVSWRSNLGAFRRWTYDVYPGNWSPEGEGIAYSGRFFTHDYEYTNNYIDFYKDLKSNTSAKSIAIITCADLGGTFTSIGKINLKTYNPYKDEYYDYNGYTCLKNNVVNYTCNEGFIYEEATKSCTKYLPE
jgi:hypothetical protein